MLAAQREAAAVELTGHTSATAVQAVVRGRQARDVLAAQREVATWVMVMVAQGAVLTQDMKAFLTRLHLPVLGMLTQDMKAFLTQLKPA